MKRKRNMRKMLVLVSSLMMVLAISVGATLAYLTDTDEAINTFTVGNVGLSLDETDVNTMGVKDTDDRVKANEYKLIPGHTYIKDPTVHIDAGSESAYIRMIVTVTKYDAFLAAVKDAESRKPNNGLAYTMNGTPKEIVLLQNMVTDWDSEKWQIIGATYTADDSVGGKMVYEFRYFAPVAGNASGTKELEPLFTKFTLPGEISNDPIPNYAPETTYIASLQGMKINVEAHAMQADGFDSAADAWTAFDKQMSDE